MSTDQSQNNLVVQPGEWAQRYKQELHALCGDEPGGYMMMLRAKMATNEHFIKAGRSLPPKPPSDLEVVANRLSKLETAVNEFIVEVREKFGPVKMAHWKMKDGAVVAPKPVGPFKMNISDANGLVVISFGASTIDSLLDKWKALNETVAPPASTQFLGLRQVDGEGFSLHIDPTASPSGIPFEVALMYLKAGRRVFSPTVMVPGWYWRMVGGVLFNGRGDDFTEVNAEAVLANDWVVIEEPAKP